LASTSAQYNSGVSPKISGLVAIDENGDAADSVSTLEFFGGVAYIDDNNSGNPLDPLNRLFIGGYFYNIINIDSLSGLDSFTVASLKDDVSNEVETTARFVINFPGETGDEASCSCALYTQNTTYTDYTVTESDFVIEPTKWWPYDDGQGNPVWNDSTGVKL